MTQALSRSTIIKQLSPPPLELLLRVITVSVETMQIINALPKMDICAAG